jgi:hypothetical protein
VARERNNAAQECAELGQRRAARGAGEGEILRKQRFAKRDDVPVMRDFHVSVEERGTANLDLGQQRAEGAIRGVVASRANLRARFFVGRSRLTCHRSVAMTAAALLLIGNRLVRSTRPVAARKQRMERLPEQSESTKCNQRRERQTAICSGNKG